MMPIADLSIQFYDMSIRFDIILALDRQTDQQTEMP